MIVKWPGKSGLTYTSQLEPITTWLEEIGGVYIVCEPLQPERWNGIEFGVTENFRERITKQAANLIGRFPNATHVAVIPFGDKADAERALDDLKP